MALWRGVEAVPLQPSFFLEKVCVMLHRAVAVREGRTRRALWWATACLCVALVGCGGKPPAPDLGKPVAVKGKVTMDGSPAAGVDVTFSRSQAGEAAPEARQFTAHTDPNGAYSLPSVFPGEYVVTVVDPVEAKKQEEMASAEDTGKYKNYGLNSPLKAKVDEGAAEHNFELTSK
jgi:hypothetical protein